MAIPARDDDASAAAAMQLMLAAELANLQRSSTAALRGGTTPTAQSTQARTRRLDNFFNAPRPDPAAVREPPPSVRPNRADIITSHGRNDDHAYPVVPRDPETGQPLLFRPGVKPINHFKNSTAKAPTPKRKGKRVGFTPQPGFSSPVGCRQPDLPMPRSRQPPPLPRPTRSQQTVPMPLRNRPRIGAPPAATAGASPSAVTAPFRGMAQSRWASPHARILADLSATPPARTSTAPVAIPPPARLPSSLPSLPTPAPPPSAPAPAETRPAAPSVPSYSNIFPAPGESIVWDEVMESDGTVTRL